MMTVYSTPLHFAVNYLRLPDVLEAKKWRMACSKELISQVEIV